MSCASKIVRESRSQSHFLSKGKLTGYDGSKVLSNAGSLYAPGSLRYVGELVQSSVSTSRDVNVGMSMHSNLAFLTCIFSQSYSKGNKNVGNEAAFEISTSLERLQRGSQWWFYLRYTQSCLFLYGKSGNQAWQ